MEKKIYNVKSATQTQKLGTEFADKILPNEAILLHGELGAGKTTFVQGVAKALGIKSRIISPTFVLVRQHKVPKSKKQMIKTLYHVDLYRIEDGKQITQLGLDEILQDPEGIVFIEWGGKINKAKFAWEVDIKIKGKNNRKITITKNEQELI